jgi:hypothetical protein
MGAGSDICVLVMLLQKYKLLLELGVLRCGKTRVELLIYTILS